MKKYGYCQENSYHTLFIKCKGGKVTLLIVYVEDMVVIWDDVAKFEKLQGYLGSEFKIKDLGGLKYFLVIEYLLVLTKYVLDLLSENLVC